ncbi:hypothetical protein SL053_002473 [Flavobacterium psychrophilum]|nr:hypothetical protein [Flavobacterium psychrophilum]
MIIGIDETGDFSPTSDKISFFIAVLIDQSENGLEKKKEQFDKWFKTIPERNINEKGEIKGSSLNDEMLLSFVNNVYNQEPVARIEISCFDPKENNEELMQEFKKREINVLLSEAESFRKKGNEKKAKRIESMAYWYKNRTKMNYHHFFKMMLLKSVINNSFITTIASSMLIELLGKDKDSNNLLGITFKIDGDFIRGDEATENWKKLLEKSFTQFNEKNPIPTLENWKKDKHPFLEKYKSSKLENLDFKKIFKQNCNFGDSNENFEIQMADIIGIIINRYINQQKAEAPFNALWEKIERKKWNKVQLVI